MAVLFHGMSCSLCYQVIDIDNDEIVATTAFVSSESDPWWDYSDVAMHKSCFMSWEKRHEFVEAHNKALMHPDLNSDWNYEITEEGEYVERDAQ